MVLKVMKVGVISDPLSGKAGSVLDDLLLLLSPLLSSCTETGISALLSKSGISIIADSIDGIALLTLLLRKGWI